MTFGQAIREARRVLEISQKELAARIVKEDGESITPQYLNDIERDRRVPAAALIPLFARVLKLDPDYLHVLAGQLPVDLRAGRYEPETVQAAIKAFRRKLHD